MSRRIDRRAAAPGVNPRRALLRAVVLRAATSMVVVLALTLAAGRWLDSRVQRFDAVDLDEVGVLPPDPFASSEPVPDGAPSPEPTPAGQPDTIGTQVRAYLVYSTGSAGMTREEAARFGVADLGRRGEDGLTDVMMVLLIDEMSRRAAILSIPRDTWLPQLGTRINGVLDRYGLQAMVDAVADVTGLPVNHLIEVNFTAFAELVEVLDGVPVQIDTPLRDYFSGLWLPETGCILLDPLTALAYVRSRHTESPNARGGWGLYGLGGDFARTERQRRFLAAAWDDLRGSALLTTVPRLLDVMTRNVTVDDGIGVSQIRSLASAFQGIAGDAVESHLLPGNLGRAGEASVVRVDGDAAQPILTRLRNWPPDAAAALPAEAADGPEGNAAHGADAERADSPPATETPAATCSRDVALPAPGTPPPGRPPAYLLDYVYGPPEDVQEPGGSARADAPVPPEPLLADTGTAASPTAPEPPEPVAPRPDADADSGAGGDALADGGEESPDDPPQQDADPPAAALPTPEEVPEPTVVPEPVPMPQAGVVPDTAGGGGGG